MAKHNCIYLNIMKCVTCKAERIHRERPSPSSPRWTRWWRARPSRCSSPPAARRILDPRLSHSCSRSDLAPWTTGGMLQPLPSWDSVSHRFLRPALPCRAAAGRGSEWNWMQGGYLGPAAPSHTRLFSSSIYVAPSTPCRVRPSLALGGLLRAWAPPSVATGRPRREKAHSALLQLLENRQMHLISPVSWNPLQGKLEHSQYSQRGKGCSDWSTALGTRVWHLLSALSCDSSRFSVLTLITKSPSMHFNRNFQWYYAASESLHHE